MICKTLDLGKEYGLKGGKLSSLCIDMPFDQKMDWKRPAVIVVPGGGYGMCSKREAETVAAAFLARGFQTFILTYTTVNDGVAYPEQLLELACAVDYVKKNAQTYSVNPDEVFVVGFSAGGHLSGNLSTDYTQAVQAYGAPLDCKVTAAGLCYPVITSKKGHFGSYQNLLNGYTDEEKQELMPKLNLNEIVCEHTAPAFIWATSTDKVVPPSNALRYALALDDQEILYELHVYPTGVHGLSTCDGEVNPPAPHLKRMVRWVDDCAEFFRQFVKESY